MNTELCTMAQFANFSAWPTVHVSMCRSALTVGIYIKIAVGSLSLLVFNSVIALF